MKIFIYYMAKPYLIKLHENINNLEISELLAFSNYKFNKKLLN